MEARPCGSLCIYVVLMIIGDILSYVAWRGRIEHLGRRHQPADLPGRYFPALAIAWVIAVKNRRGR